MRKYPIYTIPFLKLTRLLILLFTFSFVIFSHSISETADMTYNRSGQVITEDEADYIKEFHQLKDQNERLYSKTIAVLQIRSEELEKDIEQKIRRGYPTSAGERQEEKDKIDDQLKSLGKKEAKPFNYKEQEGFSYRTEIHRLKKQNIFLLDLIIEMLQSNSKDIEGEIHRAVRMGLPRKARGFRNEKAEIDGEIESFMEERDTLLK